MNMASSAKHEETQVLDIDSVAPGGNFEDVNGGIGLNGSTVPFDDTQNMFVTELEREDISLYGETQALDDLEFGYCDVNKGTGDWGKTQLVDDDEEAAIGGDKDEITERTELVSDGEDILDDGASPSDLDGFTGEGNPGGEEAGMEKKLASSSPTSADQEKKDCMIDLDASTDEEGVAGDHIVSVSLLSGGSCKSNPGSGKRSFAAVRAASLRSSGLAASRSLTPKRAENVLSSYVNGESGNKQDGALGALVDDKVFYMRTRDVSSLDCRDDETDLDSDTENSNRCEENYFRCEATSRIKNSRVKKLFNDVAEETGSKMEGLKGETPNLLFSESAIAGLSYVGSQEPGEQSQANALDIVDKLLCVNDVGLSQKVDPANNDMVKSPPTSLAKGVQSLVKRVDQRIPLGKEGIFDWDDNLEDEGGGEFFSKKKDAFFENKSSHQKSRSQLPKSGQLRFQSTCSAVAKSAENEFLSLKANQQVTNLTRSDSRIMVHNSGLSGKLEVPKKKTKKNLFKVVDEQSNLYYPEQLGAANVDEDLGGICDIGPDTQMAAEAMEALGHGSHSCYEPKNSAHPAAEVMPTDLSKNEATEKALQSNARLRKKTSSTNPEDTMRRSKRTKAFGGKESKFNVHRCGETPSKTRTEKHLKNSSNSRGKKNLEAMSKTKEDNGRIHKYPNTGAMKRRSSLGEFDELDSSGTSNGQLSSHNASPIAHRTRHAKVVNQMNFSRTSAGDRKYANELMDLRTPGAIKGEGKLITDAPELIVSKTDCSSIASDQAIGATAVLDQATFQKGFKNHTEEMNIDELHPEGPKANMLQEVAFSHPKRRRSCKITSAIPSSKANLKKPSLSVDGVPVASPQPSKVGQKKVFIRSVRQILDTAIRKKRSFSMRMLIEGENMSSSDRSMLISSGVRPKSSLGSFSSKSSPDKDWEKCLAVPISHQIGSDAVNNCSAVTDSKSLYKEVAVSKQSVDSISHAQDPEENTVHDGAMTGKVHNLGSTSTRPSKDVNAVSPVCTGQDPSRISGKNSAIARELIRLEATAPTQILKDVRRRKDMASIRVLFSHHLDEDIIKQQKKIMSRLGVSMASSISDATHFVADKFVRTRNMLEAIAQGKPIVTHMWLESCGQASCFIDEKNYILRDLKKEKEIGFSMPVSLSRACQCSLLEGRRVFITPNVEPDRELVANLVKAAQGQPVERLQRSAMKGDKVPEDLLIVSCEKDYSKCITLLEKGAEVFSTELILNGIVVQKLEYARHRLFLDHVRRTRSTVWLRDEHGKQFVPVTRCA